MVINKQKQDENKVTYIVKLNNNNFLLNIYMKNKYNNKSEVSKKDTQEIINFEYGDYINIIGKISIPEKLGNIGEYEYGKYLKSKDICGLITVNKVENAYNAGNKFIKVLYDFKKYISAEIDKKLNNKEAELLKGMLYGDITNLDEQIKDNFNEIGISHITSVSGSNLNMLLLILSFMCFKVKNNKKVYTFIQIIIIISFCFLANLELSVIRAAIMQIIVIICNNKNIKLSIEKIVLITLYIITVINPFRIYNIGMIYSFLAIIGLVFFSERIYNFLESKIKWNLKNKNIISILCGIAKILSVTLSVNILVLPFSIYYFNKFSIMFVLSNLLVSTLCTIINIFGIISIILTKIPVISTFCYYILGILLKLIISISQILNDINICIKVKSFPIVLLIIYYMYIVIICIKFRIRKKHIKFILNRLQIRIKYIGIILIFFIYLYNIFLNNYIYFFNVGQGDMAIIKKKNTVIMIDSGSVTNDTSYIFKSYIAKEGIKKVDALVISHFHSDHINGIAEIAKNCKIEYLIYSYPYDINCEEYINLIRILEKINVKKIVVKSGDNISINQVNINILSPNSEYLKISDKIDENENANSMAINVNINRKNCLFMGDSLKESEENIIKELNVKNISKIEIVKIGHHGSKTSTSEKFVQHILPKYAIISSKRKVYNHPSEETIRTLDKYCVKTYITEKVGGIKYII